MNSKRKVLTIYRILEDHYGNLNWWPAKGPFEVIVGAILTQNTNWKNVEKAVGNLRKEGCLTPERVRMAGVGKIEKLVRSAGYYRVKARRIMKFVDFLFREYGGSVEKMFREDWQELRKKLLRINGIGEETADSILLYAGKKPVFVVDQYTRRICERHGLIDGKASYGDIQSFFMGRLPADEALYNQYHALIVQTGKEFCRKEPRCAECPLGEMAGKEGRSILERSKGTI